MTDYLADTPYMARGYCPGCEPDADPTREILEARWCEPHTPGREGADDRAASVGSAFLTNGEAEGEVCRAFARLIT